jgi:hypothetical protein
MANRKTSGPLGAPPKAWAILVSTAISAAFCTLASLLWGTAASDFDVTLTRLTVIITAVILVGSSLRLAAEFVERDVTRGCLDAAGKTLAVTASLFALLQGLSGLYVATASSGVAGA